MVQGARSSCVPVHAVTARMSDVDTVAEENCHDEHVTTDRTSSTLKPSTTATTDQPSPSAVDPTPTFNSANTTPLNAVTSPSAVDPTPAFNCSNATPLKHSTTDQPPAASPADASDGDNDDASAGVRQRAMYERFRSWTLRNYGEAGKTKTVTRSKYDRVVALLSGVEPPTADNSKLRFWIKAKGFRLGCPRVDSNPLTVVNRNELYIPSKNWVRFIQINIINK